MIKFMRRVKKEDMLKMHKKIIGICVEKVYEIGVKKKIFVMS